MDSFDQVAAESFAFKLMLSMLFAKSPEALAGLDGIDPLDLRATLGRKKAVSKEFIDRVLETMDSVRETAAESARRTG